MISRKKFGVYYVHQIIGKEKKGREDNRRKGVSPEN